MPLKRAPAIDRFGVDMSDGPERIEVRSADIAERKAQEWLRLFPEIGTEGGGLDFDRPRLALGEAVKVSEERFGMNRPGKAGCRSARTWASCGRRTTIRTARFLAALLDPLAAGRVKPIVAERIPLAEALRAHQLLGRRGHAGEVALVAGAWSRIRISPRPARGHSGEMEVWAA
jgi:hypothetical protein